MFSLGPNVNPQANAYDGFGTDAATSESGTFLYLGRIAPAEALVAALLAFCRS